jgi:hypothetical protein
LIAVEAAEEQKYLRAALTNQYNLILVVGALAFAAALASWLPAIFALLAEALWLVIGPRLDTFRAATDARFARAGSAKALEALAPEYAQRVSSLEGDLGEIQALCAARADLPSDQRQDLTRRLRPVQQMFLSVCATHQRLKRVASQAPIGELQAEVSALHQSLATETDLGMRASLRRALNVAERRIKQFESNESAARSLELALTTLQKSLAMLKEGAAGLSSGPELCAEVEAASSQLTRAATLEAERETDFGASRVSLPPALN